MLPLITEYPKLLNLIVGDICNPTLQFTPHGQVREKLNTSIRSRTFNHYYRQSIWFRSTDWCS